MSADQYFKTVATLIIAPAPAADKFVKRFVTNDEIDSLVSLGFDDIYYNQLTKYIPRYKIKQAKKIYRNCKVQPGYLHKFILRGRPDIVDALKNIPDSYKLICQVECPKRTIKKYKNIDVGFTSNGKYEARDKTLIGCAIRETFEEASLNLKEQVFCPIFQSNQRERLGFEGLPLNFSYNQTFCYVLVL